ncbi:MAG: hypothetical protein LBQ12_03235 [Deltaproteobacteria bacterium]|jgi:hypothetical protein|nr:hypothetical protein [Deltaproteobacteria bacterium]
MRPGTTAKKAVHSADIALFAITWNPMGGLGIESVASGLDMESSFREISLILLGDGGVEA